MNEQKYIIETTTDNKPKTYSSGHDIYIKITMQQTGKSYYIPIMLPRRKAEINFCSDIENGNLSSQFYDYVQSQADLLTDENVEVWKNSILQSLSKKETLKNEFLKTLIDNETVCSPCKFSKTDNPQKVIQFLRDDGYVISTHRAIYCNECNKKTVHYILTPVLSTEKTNYETIPDKLKIKICKTFNYTDAYSGIKNPSASSFIPDHKFPEDRWDKCTATANDEDMSQEEIRAKFQLLTTQINLHKQKQCAKCITSGKRGYPYGIKFYYEGDENWNPKYPKKGTQAEQGCVGCGWYDLLKWKEELNKKLSEEH